MYVRMYVYGYFFNSISIEMHHLWLLILVAVIVLLFYLRKEGLEGDSAKVTTGENAKVTTGEKDAKDSTGEKAKDAASTTTVVIVDGGNRYPGRPADPFYAMTDPYWATYNYRLGPHYRGQYIPRHRRIW
jgi:hypothetical protein